MNILELSRRSKLPVKALRRLEKLKVLKLDPVESHLSAIMFYMYRNRDLSVAHLLLLIADPDLLDDMAFLNPGYAKRARQQIDALGDVAGTIAPKHVTAAIASAAKGIDDAMLTIADWLKAVLPGEPVGHAWVAIRMLSPLNEFMREQNAPLIATALMQTRKLPELQGWWKSEKIGTKSVIKYFNPVIDL